MSIEVLLFIAFGGLAIAFAVGMILSKNAVHSALFLIGNFGCVAFLFLMLNAPFISMVQIAVYAGAIMVLFLFVIMLLGAEKTTDTAQRFPWLTGVATFLTISLLIALGLPLLRGFTLPTYQGADPLIRFTNAAVDPLLLIPPETPPAADASAAAEALPEVVYGLHLTVQISGGTLAAPVVFEDVTFGETTDFTSIPAGDYTLTLLRTDTGSPVARPMPITLAHGQVLTLTAFGQFDLNTSTLVDVEIVQNSLEAPPADEGRLLLFNGYTAPFVPLLLVDLGGNRALDIRTTAGVPTIIDPILAQNILYGEAPVVATYPKGTYTLAVVQPIFTVTENEAGEQRRVLSAYEIIHELNQFVINADEELPLLLVKDGLQPVTDDTSQPGIQPPPTFEFEAVVLRDSAIQTNPTFGGPGGVGMMLFTTYLLPVNLVGLLLLVALIGVIIVTRPFGEKQQRRGNIRRKVSRPLVSVINQQTGSDVVVDTPKLPAGEDQR